MIIIKAHFVSFGCKVNYYETENIKQNFLSNGYDILDDECGADVYVINSCTVTSMSDKKIRQTIHHLRKINPSSVIVLTGCFPQAFEEEAKKLSDVDIITGSKNRTNLIDLVSDFLINQKRIVKISEHKKSDSFEKMKNSEYADKTRAFIKIQDGCDQFCSYCIIPTARGRIRSKPLEDLLEEVTELAASGHKEVVLVGINLSFYGKEFGLRLVDAVELCCSVNGIERVRLSSLEPEIISDEDINRLSRLDKLCPHFHLSLQSGCDKTLKEMNRKYTTNDYYELVTKLRKVFKDCAITTDIMVGFPGETDENFNDSLSFVKKVCFNKVHIFPYSKREGTAAARRIDQIQSSVKTIRAKQMAQIAKTSVYENLKKQIGNTYPVLFERENCTEFHQGYAPNYTLVKIPAKKSDKSLRREIICVRIKEIQDDFFIGEIIK